MNFMMSSVMIKWPDRFLKLPTGLHSKCVCIIIIMIVYAENKKIMMIMMEKQKRP